MCILKAFLSYFVLNSFKSKVKDNAFQIKINKILVSSSQWGLLFINPAQVSNQNLALTLGQHYSTDTS